MRGVIIIIWLEYFRLFLIYEFQYLYGEVAGMTSYA